MGNLYAKLNQYQENLIALAKYNGPFLDFVASELVNAPFKSAPAYDIRKGLIKSALARQDDNAVRRLINEWEQDKIQAKSKRPVFKWIPGKHYYVLDAKFDTLKEAIKYLQLNNYIYEGLIEKYVYPKTGD